MAKTKQQSVSQQVRELQREVRARKNAECAARGYHSTTEQGTCVDCGGPW